MTKKENEFIQKCLLANIDCPMKKSLEVARIKAGIEILKIKKEIWNMIKNAVSFKKKKIDWFNLEDNDWRGEKVYIGNKCMGYANNMSWSRYHDENFSRIKLECVSNYKEYRKLFEYPRGK